VEIGIGLDTRLGLSTAQLRDLAPAARALGYGSMWTPAALTYDPVELCIAWHARSGLATGVSVVPIARNPASVLGLAALTAHELTDSRFTLGIGAGSVTERPIAAVRDYIGELRKVAPNIPIVVAALGPQMIRIGARHAQGVALNWCTPEHVDWSREQARQPTRMIDYLRVCVDDDVAAARRTLAAQILLYALVVRRSGSSGYHDHFVRMGFGDEMKFLEARQKAGASDDELAAAMPERMLTTFGYAGRADGAQPWLAVAAQGLDVAIVRVLSARPGDVGSVRAAMEAFAPAH
jgi:alkanesulfonate monooxygenase SsuD/methylene tetrahydromethanopterin reductase-like flavin-dependent oxidoreductase (luciferase family)